ncbi:MAG: LysR family transcriptional regulator [Lachnospiraceae bacterium]|nr:LysR family transcriptional regulator [Lachnospiraceae bacterium]
MELRTVRTFLFVCELNSFTRAAEKLNYTQSTVTLHIQQLEAELGTALFNRINRKISLTEQGRKFYEYASELLQIEEQAKQAVSGDGKITGTLRFGVIQSLLTEYLIKILPRFRERFPEIKLDVTADISTNLLRRLKQNEFDLIMMVSRPIWDKDVECLCYAPEPVGLTVSSRNPLAGRVSVSLEEALSQPFILPETPSLFRDPLDDLVAKHNLDLNTTIQINDTRAIAEFVEADAGISLLPEYAVRQYLNRGTITSLWVPDLAVSYCTRVLKHKHRWMSPQMKGMQDLIAESTTPYEDKYYRLFHRWPAEQPGSGRSQ